MYGRTYNGLFSFDLVMCVWRDLAFELGFLPDTFNSLLSLASLTFSFPGYSEVIGCVVLIFLRCVDILLNLISLATSEIEVRSLLTVFSGVPLRKMVVLYATFIYGRLSIKLGFRSFVES